VGQLNYNKLPFFLLGDAFSIWPIFRSARSLKAAAWFMASLLAPMRLAYTRAASAKGFNWFLFGTSWQLWIAAFVLRRRLHLLAVHFWDRQNYSFL